MPKPKKNPLNNYAKYSSIAMQMGVIILGGTYGGVKLDEILALNFPAFTLSFSILSVAIAIYLSIRDLLKPPKKKQ